MNVQATDCLIVRTERLAKLQGLQIVWEASRPSPSLPPFPLPPLRSRHPQLRLVGVCGRRVCRKMLCIISYATSYECFIVNYAMRDGKQNYPFFVINTCGIEVKYVNVFHVTVVSL